MTKFAEGGTLTQPVVIMGDNEPVIVPEGVNYERLGDLIKVLSWDALILELEEKGETTICLKQS